jgi:TonB-dependent receptor
MAVVAPIQPPLMLRSPRSARSRFVDNYRNYLLGRRTSLSLVALLVAGSVAMAADMASEDGHIRGRVLNAKSGHALEGAEVTIKPGNTKAVTDREGFFTVHKLHPGTYTVEVNYEGLERSTQTAKVEPGGAAALTFKLQEMAGITIEVTDSRVSGEVEALNKEKTSMDIVTILPAEVIKSLPNANVAEAIGRLPSVSLERDEGEGKYIQVRGLESRYTSVSVNGVRIPSAEPGVRQIKLDAFPSDLMGTIELHKTVSADLEGDAVGGAVNLLTKNAPDGGTSSLGFESGYNPQSGGRYRSQMDGTFTQRYQGNALGVVLGATYDRNGRSINDVEPTPAVNPITGGGQVTAFNAADLRDYRYDRKRYGAAGGLDYRLDDNSAIYLKAFYSKFENFGDRWVTSISTGNFITPTTTDATGGYSGNATNRRPIEETYSITAGGKHDLGSAILDYSLSYSHASQDYVNALGANYEDPQGVAFNVDSSNGNYPTFTPIGAVNFKDPSQWRVTRFSTTNEQSGTRSTSFEVNSLFPYEGGLFKVGVKYRDEDKTDAYDNHRYDLKNGMPTFTLDQGLASFSDSSFYGGHYQLGPFGSLYAIQSFVNAHPASFPGDPLGDRLGNDPNDWDAKEKVAAVYVKNTSQLASAQLEYGVRFEHTSTSFTANKVTTDASGAWLSTTPIDGSKDYSNLLPSASWRYEFDKETLLRVVYGWAIARPNYGQLVPSLQATDITVPVKTVIAGNPDLKPTKGTNYDVLFERFLPSVGVFSAGVFYKDLKDPIYDGSSSVIVGGLYDGYKLTKPINGPKANLYGFELAWKQHLGFLPGAWSGLGIDTNYTHTKSKATFDASTGRSGSAALQRTAPDLANLGLTYDSGGFSCRAALSYNSSMIFSYAYQDGAAGGLTGPLGDTYIYAHTQVDAQASYTFKNGLKVVLSGLNLTNEVFGFYSGSPQWNIQREFYDRTFSVGLKKNW